VPIVWPVGTSRGSSGLHYPGGTSSPLWKMFARYGVDLYLSGEVHDVSVAEQDGVTQISHGGLFQFGLTNALLLDFYDNSIYLTLRDYDMRARDAADGTRLWETRRRGLPKLLEVADQPFTIGTALLPHDGDLESASGVLQ